MQANPQNWCLLARRSRGDDPLSAPCADRDAIEEQKQREGNTAALRFESMLTQLGDFPDKNIIDQLTLTAKAVMQLLGAAGAKRRRGLTRVLHVSTAPALIPLFYLLDSILKNVGRAYVTPAGPDRRAPARPRALERQGPLPPCGSRGSTARSSRRRPPPEAICQPVLDQARGAPAGGGGGGGRAARRAPARARPQAARSRRPHAALDGDAAAPPGARGGPGGGGAGAGSRPRWGGSSRR